MLKFASSLVWITRAATGIAFAVLIGAVIIQVLGRSLLASSPVWTEELTRYALLFLAAFGTGLSFRSGDLVNVDILSESLPGRWPWLLRLFGAIITALMCAVLLVPAWKYTSIGAMQTSPALGWRMDLIHISMLILITFLMLFAMARAVFMILTGSDGLPENRLEELHR